MSGSLKSNRNSGSLRSNRNSGSLQSNSRSEPLPLQVILPVEEGRSSRQSLPPSVSGAPTDDSDVEGLMRHMEELSTAEDYALSSPTERSTDRFTEQSTERSPERSINVSIKPQKNVFDNWSGFYLDIWSSIRSKADILIALYHFLLVNNKYTCLGVGDDKVLSENEHSYPSLPPGWNYFPKYALRYSFRNCGVYLLQAHVFENVLVINFLSTSTKEVSNVAFNPETLVKGRDGGRLRQLIPKADEVVKEMVRSFCTVLCKEDAFSANLQMRPGTDPSTWVGVQNSYPSIRTELFSEPDSMRI